MELRVAAASRIIDPIVPCEMGSGPKDVRTTRTQGHLEANGVLFRCEGTSILVISIDALYVGAELRSRLELSLEGRLDPSQIFVAASHTHNAPMLDTHHRRLGGVVEQQLSYVCDQLSDLATGLTEVPGSSAKVETSTFRSQSVTRRRRKRLVSGRERMLQFRAVANAPSKREVSVVGRFVLVSEGKYPIAVIWQLPCHPTSYPHDDEHSAHFPGWIRSRLRERFGDIPVLFLQGFSADLRPPAVRTPRGPREWLRRALLGPWFSEFSEKDYAAWCSTILEDLDRGISRRRESASTRLECRRVEVPLNQLTVHANEAPSTASSHYLRIGEFKVLGISAEVPYELDMAHRGITSVSCIDDVFGYAPTDTMREEGGYESEGFLKYFDIAELGPGFGHAFASLLEAPLQDTGGDCRQGNRSGAAELSSKSSG